MLNYHEQPCCEVVVLLPRKHGLPLSAHASCKASFISLAKRREAVKIAPDVLVQNAEISTGKAGDLPQCMLVECCQTMLSRQASA